MERDEARVQQRGSRASDTRASSALEVCGTDLITALTLKPLCDRLHFLHLSSGSLSPRELYHAPSPRTKTLQRGPHALWLGLPKDLRRRCAESCMVSRHAQERTESGVREEPGRSCYTLTFPFGLAFLNTLWKERKGRLGLAYPVWEGHSSAELRTRGLGRFSVTVQALRAGTVPGIIRSHQLNRYPLPSHR